jgi:hypothetical protein
MDRFWIGVGLMAALLVAGLFSAQIIDDTHAPIAATLEQAAQATAPEAATALLEVARQEWDAHWHITAVLADHNPMDEIDSLFSQAQAYLQAEQMGDFSALCLRIAQLIRAAAESHKPTWWNFL